MKKMLAGGVVSAAVVAGAIIGMPANAATCPPGTNDPGYCQSGGGAMTEVDGDARFEDDDAVLDTGVMVECTPRLPVNCGGSVYAYGPSGLIASRVVVAKQGFFVRTGSAKQIRARVNKNAQRALRKVRSVRLTIYVITRGADGRRHTLTRRVTVPTR